jgi:3',5'-cyclic AMP phosphodiesterase CpdA
MKPLRELTPLELEDLAKLPVRLRCARIVDEFDEWLAIHVLWLKLKHDELPQVNDAFRDYFADTRTARSSGAQSEEDPAATIRRLRLRLHVVDPVYRAAVALHRNSARQLSAQQTIDATLRVERAVDRALENERLLTEGFALSISDAALKEEFP